MLAGYYEYPAGSWAGLLILRFLSQALVLLSQPLIFSLRIPSLVVLVKEKAAGCADGSANRRALPAGADQRPPQCPDRCAGACGRRAVTADLPR